MSKLAAWLKRYDLVVYFVLAYAISWSIGIYLAISATSQPARPPIPFALQHLYGFGPMLSAILMTALTRGREGLKQLWDGVVKWRVRPIYWLAAVSPLVLLAVILAVMPVFQGQPPDLVQLGEVSSLPNLGLIGALLLWIITSGVSEEIGWRGYALPRLQVRSSALVATLILSIFWGLWHLPLFFFLYPPSMAAVWFLSIVAAAIVFTWLFNGSRGSILMAILFHGTFNFVTASSIGNGLVATLASILVMVWAVVVVFVYKPATLAGAEKRQIFQENAAS